MKKIIIILGIILTSGITALALSIKNNEVKTTAEVKAERNELVKASGQEFNSVKSTITNAD
ncbi:hypothetical protein [Mucilaginibacter boryungensis]|uniref:YtxH-like protein n=1 Tax=Mucilaginibacter boryungensis TaxID=768480 RepID=A0ABR9XIG6_9SPHI|nr:hypothetical protein [Mucilaginibacter boryungensis]MBE9667010.1 hypothetical protein [Mucilaginibacter boryungensis]